MFESADDFLWHIERTQGLLATDLRNISLPREDLLALADQYAAGISAIPTMIDFHGSQETIREQARREFTKPEFLHELYYRPWLLQWALREAELALGDQWALVKDFPVGAITAPIFNACACKSPDGWKVVVLNLPLIMRLYDITLSLTHAYSFVEADQSKAEEHRVAFQSKIRQVRSLPQDDLSALFVGGGDLEWGADAVAVSELAAFQILFVLLHEYAHIVLGHLGPTELQLAHPMDDSESGIKYFTRSQAQEFAADARAYEWMLGLAERLADEPQHGLQESAWYKATVAPCFIFPLLRELERGTSSDTHPPAMTRLKFLFALCRKSEQRRDTEAGSILGVGLYKYKRLWGDDVPPDILKLRFEVEE